jgi:rSAM/selenodomain-associated transferase 2
MDSRGLRLSKAAVPGSLSVIIPTLNASGRLQACLSAIEDPLVREVLVADAGSTDGTPDLARSAGARVLGPLPPSRGGQLQAGCAAAAAPWLLTLHADTRLQPGWAEAARRHMARHGERAAAFRFALDDPRPIARVWEVGVRLRSRAGCPYGDQGLLIPRALYESVGGYADIPLMEDVDLIRRLRRRPVMLPARALTSAARYRRDGYLRRSLRNWRLVTRWRLGADPSELARAYE